MSIGLFDQDMRLYNQVPFNLELMKAAAYYKRNNEIVVMTRKFDPERFSQYILRKDYDDGDFISNPSSIPNLQCGGLAYSNGIYVPFENEKIEESAPDTQIYQKFDERFGETLAFRNAFKVMTNAEHLRLSLDGEKIWEKFPKQIKTLKRAHCLFFHDPDLNAIEGSFDLILDLTKKMNQSATGRKIGSKFPIKVNNEEELLKWSTLWPTAEFYSLQFNGVINDEAFKEFILSTQKKSISDQLIYIVTASSFDENDFVMNKLPQIFKQVIFSRRNKRRLVLKYKDNFFKDERWIRLMRLWQSFHNTFVHFQGNGYYENATLYDFCKNLRDESFLPKDIFLKDEARELFKMVREVNPELFELFYSCNKVDIKGGKFEIC